MVFDALAPARLSKRAREAIKAGAEAGTLACCDISLWEIAMLIDKGRLDPGADAVQFISDVVQARTLVILPITPEIAVSAQSAELAHGDPADRIISATALHHKAKLVSADKELRRLKSVTVIW
jgi:PIN domain nuclease of toxin-antitoxin system